MIGPFPEGAFLQQRYRVKRFIGAGGEAWVLEAVDSITGERVAIRQYQKSGPEERHRWKRECDTRVNSQYVIRHLGGDEHNGSLYVVVEFFPGTPLDEYAADMGGFLPDNQAQRLVCQVAQGLQDMHAMGIVHRDLKSANILFHPQRELAKIIDLGLARFRRSLTITNDGQARGTLHYMSPEHLQSPNEVGPSSDLYAIGVIYYELVTGTLPFDGGNAIDVQRKILHEQPLPPKSIRPEMSDLEESTILRLLAKNPSDRFPSASSLLLHMNGRQHAFKCPACQSPCRRNAVFCPSCGVEIMICKTASAKLCVDALHGFRWFAIPPEGLVLGRAHLDPSRRVVSARHARIFPDHGAWYVEDLGSTNGTRVNGVRSRGPVRISNHTPLQFADVTCMFWNNGS